jgi:hypothetical protein
MIGHFPADNYMLAMVGWFASSWFPAQLVQVSHSRYCQICQFFGRKTKLPLKNTKIFLVRMSYDKQLFVQVCQKC